MASPRIIVVGGGLAGLAAVIKIAEAGGTVDLFSIVPVKRSHSVCAQGGINAAKNLKGEGDTTGSTSTTPSTAATSSPTRRPSRPCARPRRPSSICSTAWACPSIALPKVCSTSAALAERSTTAPLLPAPPPASNCSTRSTSRCAATSPKAKSKNTRAGSFSPQSSTPKAWPRHRRAQPAHHGAQAFAADAIILATGGIGAIFGKSTNSVVCTGSAQSAVFQQGAYYANGEFIQVHPTAIPGEDKLRLMSESARGEGGRVWVPRTPGDKRAVKPIPESERFYFLEEWYPKYGNLVPRDVATRAIHKVVYELGLGIDGQPMVYLDLTHIDRETLHRKLGGILEIYEKFVGVDPAVSP